MFGMGICLLGIGTLLRKWYKQRKMKMTQIKMKNENVSNN
jgi:hypothetical protein